MTFINPCGISATRIMTLRLMIKFPSPCGWWSNSLPPGQEKASNARGMPGGILKLRFDWYITIPWKDSVKMTLGWYFIRLRVLAWFCRKEIATAVVYVWLMKSIFILNPSAAKYFLPFLFPWQGLFNPSAGFVIPKRGSIFPITGFSFPKWSSLNTPGRIFLSPNGSK